MFEIYGGKAAFDQWDLNQRVTCSCLKVGDPVVFNAHGKRYTDKAYEKDGGIWADVPNFLLQKHGSIRVELGHGLDVHLNCRTYFDVVKKDKPDGYDCPYNVELDATPAGASSWNDLKDKPFYAETKTTRDIYVDFPKAGVPVENPFDLELVVGQTYEVTWDGVLYSCVAYTVNGTPDPVIGNASLGGEGGGGDEPFLYVWFGGDYPSLLFASTAGTHTISMPSFERTEEIIHKLDAKYLPEIGTDVKVVLTTPSGLKLCLAVDDDGRLYAYNPNAV